MENQDLNQLLLKEMKEDMSLLKGCLYNMKVVDRIACEGPANIDAATRMMRRNIKFVIGIVTDLQETLTFNLKANGALDSNKVSWWDDEENYWDEYLPETRPLDQNVTM